MKNKATGLLKQIISVITAMAKSKTIALKSKTRAIKTRLIIFSLLRNKKILMSNLSEKLRSFVGHGEDKIHLEDNASDINYVDDDNNQSKDVVLYNNAAIMSPPAPLQSLPNTNHSEFVKLQNHDHDDQDTDEYYNCAYEVDDEEKYPDLTHSMFDESEDFEDPGGSVIDIVKNSKPEGEEFNLEKEIDHAADLFIKRFHRQMRIQKQLSLKRYQDMLERSV